MHSYRTNLPPGAIARAAELISKEPIIVKQSPPSWLTMSAPEREAFVRGFWDTDLTIADAADQIGCSYTPIAEMARKLKLPRRNSRAWGWKKQRAVSA